MNKTKKPNQFLFKPLRESNLPVLVSWLKKPHVEAWWKNGLENDALKEKYRQKIVDPDVKSFIIYFNDNPIGYIQSYRTDQPGDNWWPHEPPGTIGIDQFIGEEEYLDQSYLAEIIREFVKEIIKNPEVKKIITDVYPDNRNAIQAYEKAGFYFVKSVSSPDGEVNLMALVPSSPGRESD